MTFSEEDSKQLEYISHETIPVGDYQAPRAPMAINVSGGDVSKKPKTGVVG